MPYDALTIDTNVIYGENFDLEGGLLAQISQFAATGDVQFVVSDIVLQETHKRLLMMAKSTRDKFDTATREALNRQVLKPDLGDALAEIIGGMASAKQSADDRLALFLKSTNATVVGVEHADMLQLTKHYFANLPPFDAAGPKKAEFPDAIALLSLEAWAKSRGERIIAISKDAGWAEFAAGSEYIDVVPDLAKGLELLQTDAEKVAEVINGVLMRAMAGELPHVRTRLAHGLEAATAQLELYPNADSGHYFEGEVTKATLRQFRFEDEVPGTLDLTVVRADTGEVVVRAGIWLDIAVEASFWLQHWDSVDREYVPLGSTPATMDVDFSAGALISFHGDLSEPDSLAVGEVELVDGIDTVDFGEIEPDRGDDYYEV